jgi:hypothetical protein
MGVICVVINYCMLINMHYRKKCFQNIPSVAILFDTLPSAITDSFYMKLTNVEFWLLHHFKFGQPPFLKSVLCLI